MSVDAATIVSGKGLCELLAEQCPNCQGAGVGSINDVIDAFRRAPTNVDRGTLFEKLMVRFFELDPALNQQYDKVWRWIDWPDRQGKPDTGIDLVARERDTGDYTAIQCKFYEPTHTLAKADIDSFFTASGKKPFTNRVIISTTDKWGKNAEAALEHQTIPVQRGSLADIAESPIDWNIAWPQDGLSIELSPAERKKPRLHQEKAIEAVLAGFRVGNDRGKLIMACGTGKTFTALKLAERIAAEAGDSARVLFLVPSISLLSQALREWTAQTELDMRAFAVCSDTKVGRLRNTEDFNVHDVPIPVTTHPATLMEAMAHRKRAKGLTVVFSTYQSLPTVAEAQTLGVDDFDLVICDEAHRTTGVTLAGEDDSNFVRIHDNAYLRAAKRLYMTATPRIYEAAQPYPLGVQLKPGADPEDRDTWRVTKMRWRSKTDRSTIIYNNRITIAAIPDQAHDYLLGSRSALDWIIDRYQVKTDKASGIINDPNTWCDEHDDATYIIELIKRVTTVSIETVKIIDGLQRQGDQR